MYESQLLHPAPPTLDTNSYPLLTLTSCTILQNRRSSPLTPVNLFTINTLGPFRARGLLAPPPKKHHTLLKSPVTTPTPVTITGVETFSLEPSAASPADPPIIWILGASAWYRISPAPEYEAIYEGMEQAAQLWLWLRERRQEVLEMELAEAWRAAAKELEWRVMKVRGVWTEAEGFLRGMMEEEGGWEGSEVWASFPPAEADQEQEVEEQVSSADEIIVVKGLPAAKAAKGRVAGKMELDVPAPQRKGAGKREPPRQGVRRRTRANGSPTLGSEGGSDSESDGSPTASPSPAPSSNSNSSTDVRTPLHRNPYIHGPLSTKGRSILRPARRAPIPLLPSSPSPPPAERKPSVVPNSSSGDWHCTLGCDYTVTNARTREGRMAVERHYGDHGRVFSEAIQTVEVESGGGERVKNLLEKLRGLEQKWEEGRPSPLKGLGE